MPSLLVLLAALLYGVSPILAKVAYAHGVSTLTFLAVRSAFATICLWLGLVARRASVRLQVLPSGACPRTVPSEGPGSPRIRIFPANSWGGLAALLITGTTLIPVQVFTYFWPLAAFPASSASVLVYTFPLHVAWMGWIFLREPVRPDEVGVLIAVVAGALLVAGQTPVPVGGNLQLVALVVSTLTAALYMVVARRIVRDVEPITAMAILAPASAVTYCGAGLALGQLRLGMPPAAAAATLGSAVLANIAAPLLLLSALRFVPAARAAMLGTLEPVVTVSLSVLLLGDAMTALRALGIVIVIGGIAALHARRRPETSRERRF